MKKLIYVAFVLPLLFACGEEKTEEVIELKTFKDKLSYTLGADHAKAISEANDPNFGKYDLEAIVKGFEEGLKSNGNGFEKDCQTTLKNMFGETGRSFDAKYAKEGSECIGKVSGVFFKNGWEARKALSQLDLKMVAIGFKQGLNKVDTLIKQQEQVTIIQNFIFDLNKMNGVKFMEKASKMPNAKATKSGLVIQTLQDGTGGSPLAGDDILTHYILMNANGDTLQSSYEMVKITKQPLQAFSLNNMIAGWQEAFPLLKKGGKYKLYVPYHLAYGEQGMFNPQMNTYDIQPFESLQFYVELLNYGKPGSLVK